MSGEKAESLANLLQKAGFKRIIAKTLAYMIYNPKTTSKKIEHAMLLRQPEVCLALQTLEKMNWVKVAERDTGGQGRPSNIYTLAKPAGEILDEIIKKLDENIKHYKDLANRLKSFKKIGGEKKI